MSSRILRRQRIVELLGTGHVRSQQELRDLLEAEGICATQATLSRDLHDLGVAKGPGGYALPGTPGAEPRALEHTLAREMLSAARSESTIVLKTRPGHANALAVEIDRTSFSEVLGTIAGDDTIFIVASSPASARGFLSRIKSIAGHN